MDEKIDKKGPSKIQTSNFFTNKGRHTFLKFFAPFRKRKGEKTYAAANVRIERDVRKETKSQCTLSVPRYFPSVSV
uniref:Uncharacterized protein n=1 Tax=Solanum tuberosum TaxID=4113 RepID=M0ZTA3_SOLTU